jgi:serine/threonine-protein kinase RsbW
VKKTSLHILNLVPELYKQFFAHSHLSDDIDVNVYKTLPRFLKGIGAERDTPATMILFLSDEKLGTGKLRHIRLARIESPLYVVMGECSEKYYLQLLSLGVQGIVHPPFVPADVQNVMNGKVHDEVVFPRNSELVREGQVRFDFLLPSKLSRILGVNRLVSMLMTEFGFPSEESTVNLPLVMDEALSNAIQHGNKGNEELKVHVRIYISSRRIVVQIEDEGEGFEIAEGRDPRELEHIYKDSGRGIYLIRELMDKVEFKKGGRLLEMEKRNPAFEGSD